MNSHEESIENDINKMGFCFLGIITGICMVVISFIF